MVRKRLVDSFCEQKILSSDCVAVGFQESSAPILVEKSGAEEDLKKVAGIGDDRSRVIAGLNGSVDLVIK